MSAARPETGVTVGKFFPFHLGHDALIRFAKARVARLYVVVAAPDGHPLPSAVRAAWIRDAHPDVFVLETPDDLPEAPEPWATRCLELLREPPCVAFTSEAYGDAWAEGMGARHEPFDPDRSGVPVSGTELRADLAAGWHLLTPQARRHYCRRIRVMGVESSGTTTLARDLAESMGTVCVAEYGRAYWEERRIPEDGWTTRDFVHIAAEQARREDEAAADAGPVLVCDTDPLATAVWHRRYMGEWSEDVAAISEGRRYALTLLTVPDFPWVQDGTRDGARVRHEMHRWFEETLKGDFVELTGGREARRARALEHAAPLVRFAPIPS